MEANAVAIKLPPFTLNNPAMWFRRAEAQFRLRGITRDSTKADHAMSVMSEDTFCKLDAWLSKQPSKVLYQDLKEYILGRFTLSQNERAQRILKLAGVPLGDQTVSEAWDEILSLATLAQADDELPRKVSLKREILLQRIPDEIRCLIPDATELHIDDLVDKADKLISARNATLNPHSVDEVHGVRQRRQQRPQSSSGAAVNDDGLCFYHAKFGADARKCCPGCTWPKNLQVGRQ